MLIRFAACLLTLTTVARIIADETTSRRRPTKVTIDDDGFVRVNGKRRYLYGAFRDPSDSITEFAGLKQARFDLTREYLLHSLLDAGLVSAFGFVKGSTFASREEPAVNLANDPYFSDGLRLVIALSPHPRPYHEVRSMLWEESSAPTAEGQTESAERYVRPLEQ